MSELETVHQIAQKTLTFPSPSGGHDDWLWDRTLRILQNIEHICRLPELAEKAISIDRFCLVAAAYFADSGLAHFASNQKTGGQRPPGDVTSADVCNVSTQTVSNVLSDAVTGSRIDKINKIITESFNRFTDITEAMVLSDGRGLEDLGAAGLLGGLRGQLIDGKSVSSMLGSWKRKIEYGYWQARLKESFRFSAVRQVAEGRFAAVEQFMNQLATENTAADMEKQLVTMLEKK
ncbi:MAG: hypothetical protein ACYTEM_05640 [Planctomycetota bacterium]